MKISTEEEYNKALDEVSNLMDSSEDRLTRKQEDRLSKLVTAIQVYENKHYPSDGHFTDEE